MNPLRATYYLARRIVIAVAGTTVLLLGVVMIVTPGPAIVVIPLGLGILGLEFAWARVWLRYLRQKISNGAMNARAQAAESRRKSRDAAER